MTREITITVKFNLDNIIEDRLRITPSDKVEQIVTKEMNDIFGYDEGFNGLTVECTDK